MNLPELDAVGIDEEHDLAVRAAIHHVVDATFDIDAFPFRHCDVGSRS